MHSKSGVPDFCTFFPEIVRLRLTFFCIREPVALIPIGERSMTIDDIKNAVKDVAVEFPISRTVLFGSRANGTFTPESDVDLIMEFNAPVTLITISKIKNRLESILETNVDIVHGPLQDDDMIEIENEIEVYKA